LHKAQGVEDEVGELIKRSRQEEKEQEKEGNEGKGDQEHLIE